MGQNLVLDLAKRGIISPPSYLPTNIHLLAITGSESYGVATDLSDKDIKGIFIPPKHILFPHLEGLVPYYDYPNEQQLKKKHMWEIHHVLYNNFNYDFRIDSIVKFFRLAKDCNPDMIDILFSPRECVIHTTKIGEMIRENRHLFLSKKGWNTFKGYSYSNLKRMTNKAYEGKRKEEYDSIGFSLKHSYHVLRLLNEIEQILTTHDLDIRANREQLKSVREGRWTQQEITEYFTSKERELERVKNESTLPETPDYKAIKSLMLNCIEEHYGSLSDVVSEVDRSKVALQKIEEILREHHFLFETP